MPFASEQYASSSWQAVPSPTPSSSSASPSPSPPPAGDRPTWGVEPRQVHPQRASAAPRSVQISETSTPMSSEAANTSLFTQEMLLNDLAELASDVRRYLLSQPLPLQTTLQSPSTQSQFQAGYDDSSLAYFMRKVPVQQ
ncbi:hypothetical protein EIP91_002185 [Steccherinum ochraceum]|uniref:Uncharacterized protein n=1 Tax=Steccherinum ochraceum TaxID=92696 RepID=A0A4R0REQ9_9APHY|nr:hypothetical protein EIP91_002185 [Steccherinum ochraceum]